MSFVGKQSVGANAAELPRDWKAVSRIPLLAGHLPKLRMYLDGLGGGDEFAALTVSGNEVTDLLRSTGVIDGQTIPGGYGIYGAVANLVTNGSFETDLTGWAAEAASGQPTPTLTRDLTWSEFGIASMKVQL